ncbi:MAG: hypothetical protein ACKO2L_17290 [Planctomycetaceae bacterium]
MLDPFTCILRGVSLTLPDAAASPEVDPPDASLAPATGWSTDSIVHPASELRQAAIRPSTLPAELIQPDPTTTPLLTIASP